MPAQLLINCLREPMGDYNLNIVESLSSVQGAHSFETHSFENAGTSTAALAQYFRKSFELVVCRQACWSAIFTLFTG